MELVDWVRFGLRIATTIMWFVLLFQIIDFFAADRMFTVVLWVYVLLHTAYVGVQSYKEYEEL